MNDREARWQTLVPVAMLAGFAALALEMAGFWPWREIRPDFLWCLAFFAGSRAPAHQTLLVHFYCGAVRDFLVGPRLGAGALAFLAAAWILLALRDFAAGGAFAEHLVLAGVAAIGAETILRTANAGLSAARLWSDCLLYGICDGFATIILYPLMMVVLSVPGLKPWRERKWME